MVQDFGGYEKCCSGKKWSAICKKLKFKDRSPVNTIRQHYEKIVHPYIVFRRVHCGENLASDEKNVSVLVRLLMLLSCSRTKVPRAVFLLDFPEDYWSTFWCIWIGLSIPRPTLGMKMITSFNLLGKISWSAL